MEPPISRSGVRGSTTGQPRSPQSETDHFVGIVKVKLIILLALSCVGSFLFFSGSHYPMKTFERRIYK